MVFVDTSIWYPSAVAEDEGHLLCRELLRSRSDELITTDYVVDEVLTLLSARGHRHVAFAVGRDFWEESAAKLVRITDDDLATAWNVFQQHSDKRWSFTDCTSYAVMKRLGVTEALALDAHFRQFGFATVSP